MSNIHETARRVLAFMRAGAALDRDGYTANTIMGPDADLRALCAHLAAVAPGCIMVREVSPPNVLDLHIGSMYLAIHNPAPACYRHREGVTDTWEARGAAGAELLRLAEATSVDDIRRDRETPAPSPEALARHQPAAGIPVDGEEPAA